MGKELILLLSLIMLLPIINAVVLNVGDVSDGQGVDLQPPTPTTPVNSSIFNSSYVPYTGADRNVDLGNFNITAGTGFFDFLGSLINRIQEIWVEDIYANGNVSFTGTNFEINTTNTDINGNVTITGSFVTNCLHCEDNNTYFHGEGFFEGNVTAPNIEVMESLIIHGNSSCTGTATACGDIANRDLCGSYWSGQRGCWWLLGTCYGTATACTEMPLSTCENQHVCTLSTSTDGFILDRTGFHGNFSINTTGNITANYFFGNGSQLTDIPTTSPSGSDTEIQFNDGGNFGADSNFTYNKTTDNLAIGTSTSPDYKTLIYTDEDDGYGLSIAGADYTGTSESKQLYVKKKVTTAGSSTGLNSVLADFELDNDKAFTGVAGGSYYQSSYAGKFSLDTDAEHTGTHDSGIFMETLQVFSGNIGTGFRTVTVGGSGRTSYFKKYGNVLAIQDTHTDYDNADATYSLETVGESITISSEPDLVAGTLTNKAYGIKLNNYGNTDGTSTGFGLYSNVGGYDTTWAFYNQGSTANVFLGKDNTKSYFGTGEDASISYDGTNMIFDTNKTGDGIAWFSNNISAQNLIDRSWYWDKSLGNSLDYVKDSDELKTDGKFDDNKLYDFERATYLVTDYDRPEIREVCDDEGTTCFNETYYPHKTTETGRLVSATVGKHEQNIYDLNQLVINQQIEIDLLKTEVCKLNPVSKVC